MFLQNRSDTYFIKGIEFQKSNNYVESVNCLKLSVRYATGLGFYDRRLSTNHCYLADVYSFYALFADSIREYKYSLGIEGDQAGGRNSYLLLINRMINGGYECDGEIRPNTIDQILKKETKDYIDAGSLMGLSVICLRKGNYVYSEELINKALKIYGLKFSINDLPISMCNDILGNIYTLKRDFKKAAIYLDEATKYDNKNNLSDYDGFLCHDIGVYYYMQSEYLNAEKYFNRSISVYKKLYGKNESVFIAMSLRFLANINRGKGNYRIAEEQYIHAIRLCKNMYGESHLNVADGLSSLAILYFLERRYTESELFFKQSITIRMKYLGENHPRVLSNYKDYAKLLRKLDRVSEAIEYENRINHIQTEDLNLLIPD